MVHNVIGAAVHTRDHQDVGRVSLVAMDPNNQLVTHLIIHQGRLLGRNVVVSVANIRDLEYGHVNLDLTLNQLKEMPEYLETDFLPPEEGWEYPAAYPPGGVVWPMSMSWIGASAYPLLSNAIVKENIPAQDVTLEAGTHVDCTDGHCGTVESVLLDDETKAMVGFVIKQGFLFTHDIQAPASWIDHVDDDGVHLKISKDQLKKMGKKFI